MKKRKKNTRDDEMPLTPQEAAELLDRGATDREEEPKKISWNVPRGTIEERDPYGKIRSQMLNERTRVYELHPQEPGLWESELAYKYVQEHPEFEAEYQAELKRREKP